MSATNDLQILYKKQYNININDMENSIYYYFDYDERSKSVNMDFQHFHHFFEINILLSNHATFFIEGLPYSIQPNDFVLLAPSLLHKSEYPAPHNSSNKRLVINFLYPEDFFGQKEAYDELLKPFYTPVPIYRFPAEHQRVLNSILNRIFTLSQKESSSAVMQLAIHSLFTEFLYLFRQISDQNTYVQVVRNNDASSKIFAITNYIHNHYSEELTLNNLAKTFYISPYHLSHQFKKVTGFTLTQYIQITRIRNIQYLLIHTNRKIADLAEDCGFTSFSQFNRIFRKLCGYSPSECRKNAKISLLPPNVAETKEKEPGQSAD